MSFGRTLQDLRLRAGMSQSALAKKAGIPVRTIQNWEISRRTPRWIGMLVALAKGLDVSLEELTADVPQDAKERGRERTAPKAPRPQPRTRKAK